ncbi:MAG: PAS domain S-box protein [Chloroflexi bacterium]|nr:PAS domain S-box protein [Chloroflexota bacterium]
MQPLSETTSLIFSHPLLQRLTRPHPSITDPAIRFKSQLLAALLGLLLLLDFPILLLMLAGILGRATMVSTVASLGVLLAQYLLNRAGFYRLSAWLLILTVVVAVVVAPMFDPSSASVIFYAMIIPLLAATFFPGRVAASVFALLIALIIVLNLLFPASTADQFSASGIRSTAFIFFMFQGAFLFVLVYSRHVIETRRRAELENLNAQLALSNTSLAEASREVQASEAKWRAILANAPVMIAYTKLDGQIEFINKAVGGTLEETRRKSIYDLTPPADVERVRQIVEQVIERRTAVAYEVMTHNAEGQPSWFSTIVGPVEVDGREAGLTFISNDITEQMRAAETQKRLQQQIIDSQKQLLKELSTPVIPMTDRVIIMPIVGSIDSSRAQDMTRALLAGISANRARYVVLDVTGVPVVDTGVAQHLSRTIQAARLKGAQTIVTGISDAIAETVVDLGLDWSGIETQRDLQTGLMSVMRRLRESEKAEIAAG